MPLLSTSLLTELFAKEETANSASRSVTALCVEQCGRKAPVTLECIDALITLLYCDLIMAVIYITGGKPLFLPLYFNLLLLLFSNANLRGY